VIYYTAFDARWFDFDRVKAPLLFVSIALFFVLLGVLDLLSHRRYPARVRDGWVSKSPLSACAWTALSALLLIAITVGFAHGYWKLSSRLNNGNYEVVEGVVTQFVPMSCDGKGNEAFVVSGHSFKYSDFEPSAGFYRSKCFGGPIREGLCVRIADVDGVIARLEIAPSCHPPASELLPALPGPGPPR
jgi:hypothetical protein